MTAVTNKQVVLSLYRDLIFYTKLITNQSDRIDKLNFIKNSFRQNKQLQNENKINDLIKDGQKKLSFLKMTTPRPAGKTMKISGTFKFENGVWTEGHEEQKKKRQYKDQGLDIMDYRRHIHLLRRQHFMDR
ncbi:hypothetical protein CYY_000357 [Polysphondylium violaceum]|uniref:Complex 1 LYR protein domain-containing protein n=1 Tax=Polysphondylium violaceum TaxID=133409 RepID=A0A8J4V5R8_9MYCE|nr:hypothetical protein CYY_000357 [Polysphondylium violaceum]